MTTILELDALHIRYRSGFSVGPVFANLGAGLYHLQGKNGSGKTTLLRAMVGELRARSGHCRVCGEDTWEKFGARAKISYLPAEPDQPGFLTIEEAWRFHAELRGEPNWEGQEMVEALGLDPQMPLEQASSGQRRRAELVCALAADPVVLLLDEPFANVDTAGIELLRGWLEQWRQDRVILLTSHEAPPLEVDASWQMKSGISLELGV